MAECASESNGFTFVWKIHNYSMHALRQEDCFLSPTFSTRMLNNSKWRIKLYPYETMDHYPGSEIFLGLGIENVCELSHLVAISFHLITANGLFYLDKIARRKFNANDTVVLHFKKDMLDDIFKNGSVFSSDDTLTIRCDFWIEDTLALPPEIRFGLTQFHFEKHHFQLSSRYIIQNETFYCKKTIIPKNKCMPYLEIKLAESRMYINVFLQFSNADLEKIYRLKIKAFVFNNMNEVIVIASANWSNLNKGKKELSIDKNELLNTKSEFSSLITINFVVEYSSNQVWSQIQENDSKFTDIRHDFQRVKKRYDIDVQKTVQNVQVKKEVPELEENGINSLLNDLGLLLTERKFCDVTLKIGEKEFFVHKNILCARSPVFNTMFESDMKEKETGVVNIDDIDSNIFEIFLNYLYQGKIDNLTEENAVSLYSAANKYQVLSLKKESSTYILNHLTEENVCEVLILSDMHDDERLKNASQEIFCIHSKYILLSKDWDTLLMKRPALAGETLRMLALKM